MVDDPENRSKDVFRLVSCLSSSVCNNKRDRERSVAVNTVVYTLVCVCSYVSVCKCLCVCVYDCVC